MLQLFPAPSVLGLIGQLPPMAKSFALEPLMVMRLIAIATVPVFLNVRVCGELASYST